MMIWKIKFKEHDYDEYDSFVVCAEYAKDVLRIVCEHADKYSQGNLTVENIESITCIGTSNSEKEELILGSYNAGWLNMADEKCKYVFGVINTEKHKWQYYIYEEGQDPFNCKPSLTSVVYNSYEDAEHYGKLRTDEYNKPKDILKQEPSEADELLLDVLFQATGLITNRERLYSDGKYTYTIDKCELKAYENACEYLEKKGLLKKINDRIYTIGDIV